MTEKLVNSRTCGISLDFEALNKYGIDSNRKTVSRPVKSKKSRPKFLSDEFSKESLGYWSDPDGKEYFSNFSSKVTSMEQAEQDGHQTDDEENDHNSTTTVDNQNDEGQDDLPLNLGQNSVVSEISLHAIGTENFDSLAKSRKLAKSKPCGCKAKHSAELKAKMEEEKELKLEHDKLKFEIAQGEKIQNNINKLHGKIRDLKKCKEGETFKHHLNQKNSRELSKTQLYSKVSIVCDQALHLAKLDGLTDKSEFISELMDQAVVHRKKRKADRKKRKQKYQVSASSSSSDSSSTADSSDSDSDRGFRCRNSRLRAGASRKLLSRSRIKSRSRSQSTSRQRGKICSGINEKPKESDLVMKVKWTTAMLGTKHEVNFEQMTFDQYIMGETQILNRSKISEVKRDTRIYLMKHISKLNQKLGFNKSKELYRVVLNSIEKGEFFWCDFYEIERLENEIRFNNMKVDDTSNNVDRHKSEHIMNDIKWCKDFNAGKCIFTMHHNGKFAGQVVKLNHICRVCWSKNNEKKQHRAESDECEYTTKE